MLEYISRNRNFESDKDDKSRRNQMVKNRAKLRSFEMDLAKRNPADHRLNFRLSEAMFAEATALGVFPPRDPLAGIEVDIRIAKAVNSVPRSS
jgi:hypothetical protein